MAARARIVYMGTPEFAVAPLEALVTAGHEIVGVVTVPDRPAGRGRKPAPSAVKLCAEQLGLPLMQPEKLRDPEFLDQLGQLKPDLIVVVAFRMLPEAVWKLPRLGTFNLHASLLPNYRGAAPIHRAVMNGETRTGVTTFAIDEHIDTGNILLQEATDIGPDETTGELYTRLMAIGSPLVVRTVEGLLAGTLSPQPQDLSGKYPMAPKIFRSDQVIDWNRTAREVHNHIRGLSPFPSALARVLHLGEVHEVKVFDSSVHHEDAKGMVGRIELAENQIIIQCKAGRVAISEVQWPGKRKMGILDLANGLREPETARCV